MIAKHITKRANATLANEIPTIAKVVSHYRSQLDIVYKKYLPESLQYLMRNSENQPIETFDTGVGDFLKQCPRDYIKLGEYFKLRDYTPWTNSNIWLQHRRNCVLKTYVPEITEFTDTPDNQTLEMCELDISNTHGQSGNGLFDCSKPVKVQTKAACFDFSKTRFEPIMLDFPDNNGITTIYHSLPMLCSKVNGFTKNELVDVKTYTNVNVMFNDVVNNLCDQMELGKVTTYVTKTKQFPNCKGYVYQTTYRYTNIRGNQRQLLLKQLGMYKPQDKWDYDNWVKLSQHAYYSDFMLEYSRDSKWIKCF